MRPRGAIMSCPMISDLPAALYAPQLRRYIARRVDAADVDDVLHDVAVSALTSAYTERGYLLGWLYRVALSRAVDLQRSRARRPTTHLFDAAGEYTVDDTVIARLDTAWLWPAVDALPGKQGAVLRARFQEGLSLEETAAALGMTPGAVKSAQHRGLMRLREISTMPL